jgi:hypothetical protein
MWRQLMSNELKGYAAASGRGLLKALPCYLTGGTEENQEDTQVIWCSNTDSDPALV